MGTILVIGGAGSIGRRYQAILRSIKRDFVVYDPALGHTAPPDGEFERALICSPTDKHLESMMYCLKQRLPFLVEKPMVKNVEEARYITKETREQGMLCHIVSNYKILDKNLKQMTKSTYEFTAYDYYNTGRDGLFWDCCQLIYLNRRIMLRNISPVLDLRFNYENVSYVHIEESYIWMLTNWLNNNGSELWGLQDAEPMINAVKEKAANENRNLDTGAFLQQEVSG